MKTSPSDTPEAPFAIVDGRFVLPDKIVTGQALLRTGGHIAGFVAEADLAAHVERLDAGGRLVTPGLIDIHTHGALSHTFNEPTTGAFGAITAENARRGVTSLLATLPMVATWFARRAQRAVVQVATSTPRSSQT